MASRQTHTSSSRPGLVSQQSSSVPSTPRQRPRRNFNSNSRSPSPRGLSGNHSPRSVVSEANQHMATLPKGKPACKYEVKTTFNRRRMQYDIGDEPLPDPTTPPPKALALEQEKKLSGDMRELYDRLLPSEDSEKRRKDLVSKLERILHKQWPEHEFTAHVFGSSGNLLCTSDSDVDICIQTTHKDLETMHELAEVLAHNGMERVVCVPAKVPIAKIWDPEFSLAADLNVNNTLALENTRMIKTYVMIDERVRQLAMIIKFWTRQRKLNDAGTGGTLSSYSWICMILNFLQTRKPPVIPSLHLRPHKEYHANDGTEAGFDDHIDSLEGFGRQAKNKETLGELLFNFFRYYGYEFDYTKLVVSVRNGRALTREEKGWTSQSKDGQWKLCIEEPFNATRNLGNSADATAFRGIHIEIRQAFDHLCKLDIDKFSEIYEPPKEEKSSIFKKPTPMPKPVLTPAPAHNRQRNGGSVRNRNNRGTQSGPSSRRASNPAALGRGSHQPFMSSPMLSSEFINSENFNSNALYWNLQGQIPQYMKGQQMNMGSMSHMIPVNQFNQLALNQMGYGPFQQLQAHDLNAATAHARQVVQGGASSSRDGNQNASNSQPRMYFGANYVNPSFFQGMPYQSSAEMGQPMTQSVSQDGARTNPSSPSLATAMPSGTRRGLQRSSVPNGGSSGNIRSQSQPARDPRTNPGTVYVTQYIDSNTGRPVLIPAPEQGFSIRPDMPMPQMPMPSMLGDNRKEYVGYFLQSENSVSPQTIHPRPNANLRRSSHTDLANRRDRGGRDLQPLVFSSGRHLSRSPSPQGHSRQFSAPLRSAPLPGPSSSTRMGSQSADQMASPRMGSVPTVSAPFGFPPIVNGSSFAATPPEHEMPRAEYGLYPATTPEETPGQYLDEGYYPDDGNMHYATVFSMDPTAPEVEPTGLFLQNVATDSGLVSPTTQPFSMPESTPQLGPLPTQDEEVVTSPTRTTQSQFQSMSPPAMGSLTPKTPRDAGKSAAAPPSSKPAPLLSPVPESSSRTSTPNNQPLRAPIVNGSTPNGAVAHQQPKALNMPAVTMPPLPQINGPSSARVPQNQWQTQTTGKKKGRKRAKSGPSPRAGGRGEVMPAKVEERKGG